mmetsp:Transcript_32181/g.99675  ORF Transcript_32181/g.99675 Transcript_32181/m.99675 type:complete len:254 (-) Transcript_32181:1245-2006(-)
MAEPMRLSAAVGRVKAHFVPNDGSMVKAAEFAHVVHAVPLAEVAVAVTRQRVTAEAGFANTIETLRTPFTRVMGEVADEDTRAGQSTKARDTLLVASVSAYGTPLMDFVMTISTTVGRNAVARDGALTTSSPAVPVATTTTRCVVTDVRVRPAKVAVKTGSALRTGETNSTDTCERPAVMVPFAAGAVNGVKGNESPTSIGVPRRNAIVAATEFAAQVKGIQSEQSGLPPKSVSTNPSVSTAVTSNVCDNAVA